MGCGTWSWPRVGTHHRIDLFKAQSAIFCGLFGNMVRRLGDCHSTLRKQSASQSHKRDTGALADETYSWIAKLVLVGSVCALRRHSYFTLYKIRPWASCHWQ